MTKKTVNYFQFKDKKVILDNIKLITTSHGSSEYSRHVIEIYYENGNIEYLFCSTLHEYDLKLSFQGDYWISMDEYRTVSLFSEKAKEIDKKDKENCLLLVEKIKNFINSQTEWREVVL